MSAKQHDQPHRAELSEWYEQHLRPKIAAATQTGAIPLADLAALDALIEPLLPLGRRAAAPSSRGRLAA